MGNLVKSQAKENLSLLSLKDELHEISYQDLQNVKTPTQQHTLMS
jgi:hypothetical protein